MTVAELDHAARASLVDPRGRTIAYLRVSVTDRCDFRCRYCMVEDTEFLPKSEVLSLEELDRLCSIFVALGTRKIRLTGGEPLVRRGFTSLVASLGRLVDSGDLDELTLTTNGSQLARHARDLFALGIRRINVSLDTLDADRFRTITRTGEIGPVLAGIDAALAAGLAVKIDTVAVRGFNEDEFEPLVRFAHRRGMDITLIETMPLGDIGGRRVEQYLPLDRVRADLERRFRLIDVPRSTGGPARWVRVEETGGMLGFITPMSHNFCDACNRVRLTCTGRLYTCLGHEDGVGLRDVVRASPDDDAPIVAAIREAIAHKPDRHDFVIDRTRGDGILARHMNTTGG